MFRIPARGGLLLSALLVACAGAKGGGDGGSCPAGSVASVSPSTARVTAGDAAISFGGGATNCQEMSRWSLAGPGSLDRAEGVPVFYTPPANVAAVTTATLTLTVGGLTAAAVITIDPASHELAGRVISARGAPISGAVVRVGLASASADASGAFSISGVSRPFDLTVTSPDGLITSLYPELRRMDPTLTLFDVDANYPLGTTVSGALSGGAGFPLPAGHQAGVAFRSSGAIAAVGIQDAASGYQLGVGWAAGASVTGELHALQWLTDADGRPVSYDGVAEGTLATLTNQVALTGQDLALGAVATNAVSGTIVNVPAGDPTAASISLFAIFADGTRLRVLPKPTDPSPFPYTGFQSTFSLATPVIPGGGVDLASRKDYAGGAFQECHRRGLLPSASGVSLEFGALPIQHAPVIGAVVGPGATFDWYSIAGSPVYVVSFRGPPGQPGYDVFTTAQSLTIPVGFPLPAGTSYTWRVRASTAFHTVDDSTGPGGFYGTAAAYQLAQGSDWQFTTAP